MNFYMPVRLHTGENCIEKHAALLKSFGDRCLLVTGKSAARRSGALDDVLGVLDKENIPYSLYDGIGPNPTVQSCMEAGRQAAESGAAFILGIGGGSALDAAKAAAVFAAKPELDEEGFYALDWTTALPIVLVGTTAGTGSEVTNVAVLTDAKGRKHSIHDDRMYATAAFGDARYTMSLPQAVTLSTGIDVLTHCSESWFNKKANDISRGFAAEGIRKLVAPLKAAAEGKELSLEQRAALYDASLLGGLAISVTGTCFPHNVGYYLTENYGLPHGFACAELFPELLEHAESVCPETSGEFFRRCECSREELLALCEDCLRGVKVTLTQDEIEKALPRWENNGSVKNTVGNVTTEEIGKFLSKFAVRSS